MAAAKTTTKKKPQKKESASVRKIREHLMKEGMGHLIGRGVAKC